MNLTLKTKTVILSGLTLLSITANGTDTVTKKINMLDLIKNDGVTYHLSDKMELIDDPKNIWAIQPDGSMTISGKGYGYMATKKSYRDYHLVIEFKWGGKTLGARENASRDNGILLHASGADGSLDGTWMTSFEAQIIEGGMGDILVLNLDKENPTHTLVSEFVLDRDGEMIWKKKSPKQLVKAGRINWEKRDVDWEDKKGVRGKEDIDSTLTEWTRMEVISKGDTLQYFINGILVNEAFEVKPSEGKILIQTEAAETLVRRYELWPLGEFKEKWQPKK
jgi:Domain of Unknown Function (DUF1080)